MTGLCQQGLPKGEGVEIRLGASTGSTENLCRRFSRPKRNGDRCLLAQNFSDLAPPSFTRLAENSGWWWGHGMDTLEALFLAGISALPFARSAQKKLR
jgi:hypothetical protein